MPRPPVPRRVGCRFRTSGFKPMGRPACALEVERLSRDGLEALRLADLEGLYHESAAERMGVSRATFGRVLARARASVATALVEGRVLLLEEGPVEETPERADDERCPVHAGPHRRGRGCRCGRMVEVSR